MKLDSRVLFLLVVAACGRHTPPQPPAPVTVAALEASMPPNIAPDADSLLRVAIHVPDSAVTRQALAVFGDSVARVDSAASEGPTWDIDVRSFETHQRVEYYVNLFTGPSRERFISRLEKGSRYEPMIREKFRAGNIPEDMYYLGLVESGYDPNAYSKAAAVGMWQFMTATARGTGLRVDWWIDERRDPIRSTDAAVKFLGWLREQFGSLYLAAAAYNGGPGRVSRGLSRLGDDVEDATGDNAFFALAERDYLRGETKNYVPQLIAAALVAKEPARYGMTLRTLPPYAYDSVSVPAWTPIAAVAKASGASLAEIRELNPQVLRGVTPGSGSYQLRVPVGRAAGFDSAFAALDAADRTAFKRLEAKKGQTFASIASSEGLSARQIKAFNPKVTTLKSGRLRPGQVVLVPARAVVTAALDVPDPSIEIYGSSRSRSGARVHVVKRGQTLGGIARMYGTSVDALVRLNGLKKRVIYAGQTIVVRGAPRSSAANRATKAKRTSSVERAPGRTPSKSSAARAGAAAGSGAASANSRR